MEIGLVEKTTEQRRESDTRERGITTLIYRISQSGAQSVNRRLLGVVDEFHTLDVTDFSISALSIEINSELKF